MEAGGNVRSIPLRVSSTIGAVGTTPEVGPGCGFEVLKRLKVLASKPIEGLASFPQLPADWIKDF
jgi:hypothetical protein